MGVFLLVLRRTLRELNIIVHIRMLINPTNEGAPESKEMGREMGYGWGGYHIKNIYNYIYIYTCVHAGFHKRRGCICLVANTRSLYF